jgi:hypothetical protein
VKIVEFEKMVFIIDSFNIHQDQWLVVFEQKAGASSLASFLPAGEYKTEIRIYNGRNQTFMRIGLYFTMMD